MKEVSEWFKKSREPSEDNTTDEEVLAGEPNEFNETYVVEEPSKFKQLLVTVKTKISNWWKQPRHDVRFSLDIVIPIFNIGATLFGMFVLVMLVLHTNIRVTKDDAGNVDFALSYNIDNKDYMGKEEIKSIVSVGKDNLMPLLDKVKNKSLSGTSKSSSRPEIKTPDKTSKDYKSYIKDGVEDGKTPVETLSEGETAEGESTEAEENAEE